MSIDELRKHCFAELRGLQESGDTESAHAEADEILCEVLTALGYGDLVEEYRKVPKWFA